MQICESVPLVAEAEFNFVKIGAATEAEMKEKKARIEDAVHATRAAAFEGVVPGGGVASDFYREILKRIIRVDIPDNRIAIGDQGNVLRTWRSINNQAPSLLDQKRSTHGLYHIFTPWH